MRAPCRATGKVPNSNSTNWHIGALDRFAEERDLRFVFAPAAERRPRQLSVYENATVVETAQVQ